MESSKGQAYLQGEKEGRGCPDFYIPKGFVATKDFIYFLNKCIVFLSLGSLKICGLQLPEFPSQSQNSGTIKGIRVENYANCQVEKESRNKNMHRWNWDLYL